MITTNNTVLVKSKYVQAISNGNLAIVWHSLFGHPHIISVNLLNIINKFDGSVLMSEILTHCDSRKDVQAFINLMVDKYLLIANDCDERSILEQAITVQGKALSGGATVDSFSLVISEACNFCCTYCIHFSNLNASDRIHVSSKTMTPLVAQKAVDVFVDILQTNNKQVAEINFGGGEPLIGWSTILHVLQYCHKQYPDVQFVFSLNTNASLLTPEIVQALKKYQVQVASSLDGEQLANDKVRLSSTGQGTFFDITRGFKVLEQEDYAIDGFTITMTEANFPFVDERIIDWAADRGMTEIRLDVDVIHNISIDISSLIKKILSLRFYAKKRGIVVHGFWSRPRENMDSSPLEGPVGFCGGIKGNSIVVNPSQEVYFCGYSANSLGSLDDLSESLFFSQDQSYSRLVEGRAIGNMVQCQGCIIEGQCGGGCHITQELAEHLGTKIDRMCKFYKRMTIELLIEDLCKEEVIQNE